MKFTEKIEPDGKHLFFSEGALSVGEFKNLGNDISNLLHAAVNVISMPETEIFTIQFGAAKIYAKLDFSYGAELECTNVSAKEIADLRILMTRS